MRFITGSCFLLCTPASICYLPHIYRVINYLLDKAGRGPRYCSILTQLLCISMIVQIICHAIDSIIGMNIPVKNHLNNFHFILCNDKFTIFQPISIRSKSTIPFTFSRLLLTPSHCLYSDISLSISATTAIIDISSLPASFELSIPSSTQIRFTHNPA